MQVSSRALKVTIGVFSLPVIGLALFIISTASNSVDFVLKFIVGACFFEGMLTIMKSADKKNALLVAFLFVGVPVLCICLVILIRLWP